MLNNHLFNMYTIVFIVLASANCFILFRKDIKEMATKDKPKIGLLILMFLPIVYVGMYLSFVTIYGVASMFFNEDDNLYTMHLITNTPNFYALYLLIRTLKENK